MSCTGKSCTTPRRLFLTNWLLLQPKVDILANVVFQVILDQQTCLVFLLGTGSYLKKKTYRKISDWHHPHLFPLTAVS